MGTDLRRWMRLIEDDDDRGASVEVAGGVRRPIHNSEGALIAPTSDAQVAFWRWFGKSKIIDQHGRPLVVYRGDKPGKSKFTGRERLGNYIQGNIFFTNERGIARGYTPHRTNSYLSSKDMDQSHGLYSVYLRIKKPVIVNARDADWSRIPVSGRLKKAIGSGALQIDDLALHVQQNTTSDGLIVKGVFDQFGWGNQYIVFSSEQIKLLPPSSPVQQVAKPRAWSRPVSYRWDDATQDYVEDVSRDQNESNHQLS